jgi:hypothetical protein
VSARLYASPVSLPEATSGRFAIKYATFQPGIPVAVVSMREALLTGRKPVAVMLEKPLRVHQLVERRSGPLNPGNHDVEHEGVWMSDEPLELRQAADWILKIKPRGKLLVGGLGLGIVASWLARRPAVEDVVVVEREQDVIDLVWQHQSKNGYTVVRSCIFDFLKTTPRWWWDFAFLDTWQGTNEGTWWDTVMPLRRIIGNRFGRQRVHCWAEDMMLGQVRRAITLGNRSTMEQLCESLKEPVPENTRHWHYAGLPAEMSRADVEDFVTNVGLPEWEQRWGSCLR